MLQIVLNKLLTLIFIIIWKFAFWKCDWHLLHVEEFLSKLSSQNKLPSLKDIFTVQSSSTQRSWIYDIVGDIEYYQYCRKFCCIINSIRITNFSFK